MIFSEVIAMRFHGTYTDEDMNFHCLRDERPDPSNFSMHTHEQCELFCFLEGKAVFHIEGNEYIMEPGDILVMRPAEAHCISPDPFIPYERFSLHFRKDLTSSLDPMGLLLKPFFDREAGRFNLFRDQDFPDQSHRFYINAMLSSDGDRHLQLLSNLIPLLNCLYLASQRKSKGLPAQEDTVMYRILRYINDNLSAPITLDVLCENFFISKSQLCRSFKRVAGASVGEYLTIKRLIAARNMLLDGVSPTQACSTCGFNDYSSFYRSYKKHFGVSPREDCRSV